MAEFGGGSRRSEVEVGGRGRRRRSEAEVEGGWRSMCESELVVV